MSDLETDFHKSWLGMVQPIDGLVFSIPVLVDAECLQRNPLTLQQRLHQLAPAGRVVDLGAFLSDILGLTADLFDRGDSLPQDLHIYVHEGKQDVRPTMALRGQDQPTSGPGGNIDVGLLPDDSTPESQAGKPYVALVWDLPPGLPLDKPETTTGPWDYPPAAKFDRLLRACRVPIGLLTNGDVVRLIYAPHGEATGAITFRLDAMSEPGGRPMLDAFATLLSANRFFAVAPERQLPAILAESRRRQANVTNALADQVLEALGILLAGFEAAADRDGDAGRASLKDALDRDANGDHVYGGLLTVLLRLVFLLYAEDRELLPTGHPIYARNLSVLGLFGQLQEDHGTYPDTMARRFGAWPRLLALFRAIFLGVDHGDLSMPARRGDLFNPERYPFLEGWIAAGGAPVTSEDLATVRVPSVDDETVYRVLDKLLYLESQRLSYRALDVEQIGSVYEALMGFHVRSMPTAAVCLRPARVWIAVADVLEQAADRRGSWLKDEANLDNAAVKRLGTDLKAATTEDEILAVLEAQQARGTARTRPMQLVLQPGAERRRTSSHYTPRSLSEPIVRRTLEPLLGAMAVSGEVSSDRLLELKVCDPAMGSGAFLVEACRFLADQVVAAWTREGRLDKIASAREDVVTQARRLIAQRCLYGVDKNPFAVNLAKLSLWLVTLARDEPFTFVDHALRHGDSLVGLSLDQIRAFHWDAGKRGQQVEVLGREIDVAVDEALGLRQRILELAAEHGPGVTKEKERLLWQSEDQLLLVRRLGDLVIGAWFAADTDKARMAERNRRFDLVVAALREGGELSDDLNDLADETRAKLTPFHWMVEFTEIFHGTRADPLDADRANRVAWMDAFVGNPPFAGKNGISESGGPQYLPWLQQTHEGAHGNADLCAHFFRRAVYLLGPHGTIGLIATNTIAQGDTRAAGLQYLVARPKASIPIPAPPRGQGEGTCVIYEATRSMPWPGEASVAVSVVHLAKGRLAHIPGLRRRLDGREVEALNSRLRSKPERPDPVVLAANAGLSYVGSYVLGMGFTLTPDEREALVTKNARNAERIFPYLGGEEVNTSPTQTFDRYVINFGDMSLEEAERWPDLIAIVRDKVRPERDKNNREVRRKYWWRFGEAAPALYAALELRKRCLVTARVTKHLCFSFQPTGRVWAETVYVLDVQDHVGFAVLQSRVHESWARLLSSSMRTDLRYSASDCFDTFPFSAAVPVQRGTLLGAGAPHSDEAPLSVPVLQPKAPDGPLESVGAHLYDTRARLMIDHSQGLTATYNQLKDPRCDDPAIVALRHLHEDMDRAVLAAYGWSDIPVPPYETPTTDATRKALEAFEDEIIDRLFALNAARAEQERIACAPETKKPRGKSAHAKVPTAQLELGGAKGEE